MVKEFSRREILGGAAIAAIALVGGVSGGYGFRRYRERVEEARAEEVEERAEPEILKWMSARVEEEPHSLSRRGSDWFAHVNVYLNNSKELYQEGDTDPRKIALMINCGPHIPKLGEGDTIYFDLYKGFRHEPVQYGAYSVETALRVDSGIAEGNLRKILKDPEAQEPEVQRLRFIEPRGETE